MEKMPMITPSSMRFFLMDDYLFMKRIERKNKYCSKTPIAFLEIMVYSICVV